MDFYYLLEIYLTSMKILLDTGLDSLNIASKNVAQKSR